MKPFDLEAAKRGDPIQTERGQPAKFIAHIPEASSLSRVVVLVGGKVIVCDEDGAYALGGYHKTHSDGTYSVGGNLVMAPQKQTVWVNFYKGGVAEYYEEKCKADAASRGSVERLGDRAYKVEIEVWK